MKTIQRELKPRDCPRCLLEGRSKKRVLTAHSTTTRLIAAFALLVAPSFLTSCSRNRPPGETVSAYFDKGIRYRVRGTKVRFATDEARGFVEVYDPDLPAYTVVFFRPYRAVPKRVTDASSYVAAFEGGWERIRKGMDAKPSEKPTWETFLRNRFFCLRAHRSGADWMWGLLLTGPAFSRSTGLARNGFAVIEVLAELPSPEESSKKGLRDDLMYVLANVQPYEK
jgi:hypothetical protein